MESLGVNLEKIALKPISKSWTNTIKALDRLGAQKAEEHRRKEARAYLEAQRMIHGDPEYSR